jgi:hypothetical protein
MTVDVRPVLYCLENGERAAAVLIEEFHGNQSLIVNLSIEPGSKYVGLDGWFSADFVRAWQGMVPETCSKGTEPGQWCEVGT